MDSDRLSKAVVALVELVARLRGPNGCPWDAKQTVASIKMYLIEEAYEVLDAIEKSSPRDVCMELGDLLFQILFLAQLAAERKEFDFIEVVEKITEKMIHRHPHVFGSTKLDSPEEVALNWTRLKANEQGSSHKPSSALQNVPVNLPALLRAHRLGERASKINTYWANGGNLFDTVQDEFEILKSAISNQDRDLVRKKTGDLLFGLANLTRHWGFNAEDLLRLANQDFLECFEKAESALRTSGINIEEATPDQLDGFWGKKDT